jgi:ribosomal protein S18 acetylase RimI-like enzyme
MTFRLRRMHDADLPAVLALQARAYAGAAFAPERPAVYRSRMRLAPDLCLVALDEDGALLAYLVSHPWHTQAPPALDTDLVALPADATCWYLHDCAVEASAQGRGVAGELYEAASAAARAQGLRGAALTALAPAAAYWLRLGYRVEHRPGLDAVLAHYGPGTVYMTRTL